MLAPLRMLLALPALFAATHAAPTDDMRSLQTTCESSANVVNRSLNTTSTMVSNAAHLPTQVNPSSVDSEEQNTSAIVMSLVYQIGASTANLNSSNTTVATVPWSTNVTDTPGQFDTPYLSYIACVNTFSEAITRRGKVFHDEENRPVYRALQGLAGAVHAYGLYLRDRSTISRTATIRTITAGSYVIQAQSVWANNQNFPGRPRVVRSAMKTKSGD